MCAINAKHIKQANGIRCHVRECIGYRGQVATEHCWQVWRGRMGKMGRMADIAVIEPNHVQPALNEGRAETIRPCNQLRPYSHDEQHWRCVRISDPFIRNIDVRWADVRCNIFVHTQVLLLTRLVLGKGTMSRRTAMTNRDSTGSLSRFASQVAPLACRLTVGITRPRRVCRTTILKKPTSKAKKSQYNRAPKALSAPAGVELSASRRDRPAPQDIF